MIRFLLLLLILHGAELLSNYTDEMENFMKAALETMDTEVRTPQIPTQDLTSTHPRWMNQTTATLLPPSTEEKVQKSSLLKGSFTTPANIQALQGERKKNSTNQLQQRSPGLSPNVANAHPTKVPIILSTEHVREPALRISKNRKTPTPPLKAKNVKSSTGESLVVTEGQNREELQEEHAPKQDQGSNTSFPSTNFATDVHSDEYGKMSVSKVAKIGHVDHVSGIRSRKLKHLTPGMEPASEVMRPLFTHLLANSTSQSLKAALKQDSSSVSSRLHPVAGIMSNSTSEKLIREQEAILRKGNSLLTPEHPISGETPLSNFAERMQGIFGVSQSKPQTEDVSTTSQKTRYNDISSKRTFVKVDVPETERNRLALTENGSKMATANPDLLHLDQSQLKTEDQSKLTTRNQSLPTIQVKLGEELQTNMRTARPVNGSHRQIHRETQIYEQADQVPEPKVQIQEGSFAERGVNAESDSSQADWAWPNNSTQLNTAARIQTQFPRVTRPQSEPKPQIQTTVNPTAQHLRRPAERGAKPQPKANVTVSMQRPRTHNAQSMETPADQILELPITQTEPMSENQTVHRTYVGSNPVGKVNQTTTTEKVIEVNEEQQYTEQVRSAQEMETITVLVTTRTQTEQLSHRSQNTQKKPDLTSQVQLDVTEDMQTMVALTTTIHPARTPKNQQAATTATPGLTMNHRSWSQSQTSLNQTEKLRGDFSTEIPSQTTSRLRSPIHPIEGTRTQSRPSTNYRSTTYDLDVKSLTNRSTYMTTDVPFRENTSTSFVKTQDELFTVSQSQEDTQNNSSQATGTIVDSISNTTQNDKDKTKKTDLHIANPSKNATEKQPDITTQTQRGMDSQTPHGQVARTRPDLHTQTQPNLTGNTQTDFMTVSNDRADHTQTGLTNQTQHTKTTTDSASQTNLDFVTNGKTDLVKVSKHELSTNITPEQSTQNQLNKDSKSVPVLITQTRPDLSTQSHPDLVTQTQPDLSTQSHPDLVTQTQPDLSTQSHPDLVTQSKPDLVTSNSTDFTHLSTESADMNISTEPHTNTKLGFQTQTWLPPSTQTKPARQRHVESTTQTQSELNEELQSQPTTHSYSDANTKTQSEHTRTTQPHVSPKSHPLTTLIWPVTKIEINKTEVLHPIPSQNIETAATVFITQTLVTDDGGDSHVSSSASPVTGQHFQEPNVSGREWHVVSDSPSLPVTQGSGESPSWITKTTSIPKSRTLGTEEPFTVNTTTEGLMARKPEPRLSSESPNTMKSRLSPRLSSNTFTPQTISEVMSVHPGRERIFIVDEQLPVFKVQTINVTYRMNLEGTAPGPCEHPETCQPLLQQEVTSFYKSVPGFEGVELSNFTWDGTLLGYRVQLGVHVGSSMSETQELVLSDPRWLFESSQDTEDSLSSEVHSISLTEKHADPCTDWFSCPDGFQCVPVRKLGARCQSPCHDLFCHNHGICIHHKGKDPECQCPIGSDFWYMGQTCDYRMTHHRLAAIACAVVFSIIICAAAAVFILVRRFQTQILQQKVAQTQSSYRRFSRFDDVPTHFWCPSQTWLTASASLNSLDNPAFSSSEEVFPLQALGSCMCGCQDGAPSCAQSNPPPPTRVMPRLQTSCSSVNDIMIDSGKASDVSVSSWPMEPIHWTPFPILHQLSLQSPCPSAIFFIRIALLVPCHFIFL
uniref:EGF-like domain-containing protein n=1 Tax=Leptobrachium leishanense TaxID=445787 RepID=A0A8C5PZ43_9ANUR